MDNKIVTLIDTCDTVIYPVVMQFEGREVNSIPLVEVLEACYAQAAAVNCRPVDIITPFIAYIKAL